MRRYLIPVLLLLTLVTPFALRLGFAARSSAGRAGSDALSLRIITSHAPGIRQAYADAFRAWHREHYHQDVNVDYTAYGSNDMVRALEDADTLYPQTRTLGYDLAWGGGDYLFDVQLKGHKGGTLLQGVALPPAVLAAAFPNPRLNGLPLYDLKGTPPQWFGTALSSFGITYNRDVLRRIRLPEPTRWADLADPKYDTWFVAADPTRSTSAKQAFLAVVEKAMADAGPGHEDAGWATGMGTLRRIAANTRAFVDGSSTIPGIIASGDVAAGMTIDYMGRSEAEAVGPRLGYVQPRNETVTNPDPIAMVAGAEHRETAQHFIEFVLGPDGQALWDRRAGTPGGPRDVNLRRLPVAPAAYADPNAVDRDDPFAAAAGDFNKSDARERTFNILGDLLECSCINCLDDLRETRRAILHSPHARELDDRLGTFPFDQVEALVRQKAFYDAGVTPVEQLEMKRKWTAQFRAEYAELRARAALP